LLEIESGTNEEASLLTENIRTRVSLTDNVGNAFIKVAEILYPQVDEADTLRKPDTISVDENTTDALEKASCAYPLNRRFMLRLIVSKRSQCSRNMPANMVDRDSQVQ
tara:strand:- start:93 stop:416 length:324 start_codon:yes stop_codon:yes gene_type:complete